MASDVFSPAKRSDVMSKIRSSGNRSTELKMIEIYRAHGFTGWRRNFKLEGKPDFVFPKRRLAVFVDGCFWHCCPRCSTKPKSNAEFWDKKLESNRRRDREVIQYLHGIGWKTLRLWEHELSNKKPVVKKLHRVFGQRESQ